MSNFDKIRRIVIEDAGLTTAFTAIDTEAELFDRVIALGRERGIELTAADLVEIVRANRRAWLERWLP